MQSITIAIARTVNKVDYKSIMTDGNRLFEGLQKATRGSKWKESSQRGLHYQLRTVFEIQQSLEDQTYQSCRQDTFQLHERGRVRSIDSYGIKDRTIRHVLCDDILAPRIHDKIIYDNGASVKGRGISFSRKRFEVHLRKYYMEHGSNDGYILFGDFSKYYDNILHDVAKAQLMSLVEDDPYVQWLMDTIFEAFEVNVDGLSTFEIRELYEGVLDKLKYNPDNINAQRTIAKSVSIGDQLSQQIGIYYPHEIDNYIKILRHQKYYGRYMDDWYIMSDSKEELLDLLENIKIIADDIGLHINLNKTHIVKMSSKYKYLQVKYTLTDTGKVVKRINPKRVTTMRRRLKKLAVKVQNEKIDYDNVENMFRSWMGSFHKLLSRPQREGLIDLYETLFHKKIYIEHSKMIILEEGSV